MNKINFSGKNILIVGGTGSFGNQLLKNIINRKIKFKQINILSRDEKKQFDLREIYNLPNIKFHIGDVRDKSCTDIVTKDIDYVFHAAALKQVPSCEFYPMEAIKTNILGTNNILNSSINNKVKKVICLSTDKAVYPINAMGISKAMMEKVALSKSLLKQNSTTICVTRYGNVIGSRGSVVPLITNQIKQNKPITITNKDMTRFLMTLDDALDLVFYAFKNGKNGQLFVKKSPSTTIEILVEALLNILNKKKHKIKTIGIRHGEKIHETLLSSEERFLAKENKSFFVVSPDLRDLNYGKYFKIGEKKIKKQEQYSSNQKKLLNLKGTISILKKSEFIRNLIK
ncbi:MAG: UDP-glucose 4-epimerase [Candidatus Marinimicrobia bacterium]|nr:UDP-glucose 4-epimerase [Candidatus Neomarinimicrobiota bacterium]|tara:strand:- start:2179 stop:3204 length:1026 start_codon:yes stop_codon:yes gene_type:complete